MPTILGFLFDFKSNANKAFKKLRKDIVGTTAEWEKSTKKTNKALRLMLLNFKVARGTLKNWFHEVKNSGVTLVDVIADIGDKFGGLAGVIADTLMRPGALLAASAGVAFNAAREMQKGMIDVQRETRLTTSEMAKYKDIILAVSEATGADSAQVMTLGRAFASANVPIEEFGKMMETAIAVNRLTGMETSSLGPIFIRLRKQMRMTGQDSQDFWNTLYASAKTASIDISHLSSNVEGLMDVVSRTLPDHLKEGMNAAVKIAAVLNDTFGNAQPLLTKFFESAMNVESQEFKSFRQVASFAGEESAMAFDKAMRSHDYEKAFKAFHKGIQKVPDDMVEQMFRIGSAFNEAFNIPPEAIRDLRNIDATILDTIGSSSELAKKQNLIRVETEQVRTIMEKWYVIWAKVKRIALPFGEMLLDVLNAVFTVLDAILTPIGKFIEYIGEGGRLVMAMVLGFATISTWGKPLADLALVFGKNLFGALGVVRSILAGFITIPLKIAESIALSIAMTGVMGTLSTGVSMVWAGIVGIGTAIKTAGLFLARAFLPLTIIVGAFTLLNKLVEKVFGTSLIDGFLKAISKVGDVLGWIVDKIGSVFSFFGGGSKKEVDIKVSSDDRTQKSTGTIIDNSLYQPYANPQTYPDINPPEMRGGGTVSLEPQDWRRNFGTDDLVNAQYDTARMIIDALSNVNPGFSRVQPSGASNRHTPIPDPSNFGPR